MTARIYLPTSEETMTHDAPSIFLAGTIEQGGARDWQAEVMQHITSLQDVFSLVNPRREQWDSSLKQTVLEPVFNEQVTFELDHLEKVDSVLMWFEETSLSPITLLEFGLLCGWVSRGSLNKLVVGCPPGFWRRGNIEVMCKRYHIELVPTLEEAMLAAIDLASRNHKRYVGLVDSVRKK